jgi:16S rRNA (cytosine967-C5)-methyltransferase
VANSASRLKRLEENMQRLQLSVQSITEDAALYRPSESVDAILLDAPCSASGTLRRHPDVVLRKGAKDIERLAELQRRLLSYAASLLKPGGVLVYCVCSLLPQEGEAQIEQFLSGNPSYRRERVAPQELGDAAFTARFITQAGDLRTLPHHWADRGGIDGFFASRLHRMA